jgi:hypothetical protein
MGQTGESFGRVSRKSADFREKKLQNRPRQLKNKASNQKFLSRPARRHE